MIHPGQLEEDLRSARPPTARTPSARTDREGAGWVEVAYGVSGNVESFTVHGQCSAAPTCRDPGGSLSTRLTALRACACADEQHYGLRWDELNRLVEGHRWDRAGGQWNPAARMRYRYDGANQRTVKQTFAAGNFAAAEARPDRSRRTR